MLDHLGLTSADLARSKTFFLQALAPLQIGVVMEVSAEQTGDHDHIGFGSDGKPFFWLGNGGTASHGVHVAFACASRAQVDATTARRACARGTTRITTPPSCSTRTATTSKRSAIAPSARWLHERLRPHRRGRPA